MEIFTQPTEILNTHKLESISRRFSKLEQEMDRVDEIREQIGDYHRAELEGVCSDLFRVSFFWEKIVQMMRYYDTSGSFPEELQKDFLTFKKIIILSTDKPLNSLTRDARCGLEANNYALFIDLAIEELEGAWEECKENLYNDVA